MFKVIILLILLFQTGEKKQQKIEEKINKFYSFINTPYIEGFFNDQPDVEHLFPTL